jgi:hypothetical protein
VAYLAFENGDADEFAFFLAQKLGRTVEELDEMPNDEYVQWIVYYGRKAQRQDIETKKARR